MFLLLFNRAVTISVQLVGLYLVFATLIVPALATRTLAKPRHTWAYALAALGYFAGLVLSAVSDLPSGAVIVCAMTILGACMYAFAR